MFYFKEGKPIEQIDKGTPNIDIDYWYYGFPLPLVYNIATFIPKIIII